MLSRRTWFPGPPPFNLGEVPDQAPYEVEEAYKILKTSPLYKFESHPLKEAERFFSSPGYDHNKESIVIIHTVSEDADENFVKTTVAALALRNFHIHYNVFTVQMPKLNNFMTVTIKRVLFGFHSQYFALGRVIAGFLKNGINLNRLQPGQIHLIGFCFSAQLTGYIARAVPGKIKSILALDPYSFGFWRMSMLHLSSRDAMFVHALHTSSFAQGTISRRATADFVFNNGNIQPGCFITDIGCSHQRSVPYVWYVILFSDLFIARQCDNHWMFKSCLCEKKARTHLTYPLDPSSSGIYYIRTAKHHPYGLQDIGASCKPLKTPKLVPSVKP